mmetsp:Transcript_6334/g.19122  ORF Transcript_6334/g.19122 Transcript_6334/m.19122 type:complete len:262 (+) Transcript_6334:1991-2776(+)
MLGYEVNILSSTVDEQLHTIFPDVEVVLFVLGPCSCVPSDLHLISKLLVNGRRGDVKELGQVLPDYLVSAGKGLRSHCKRFIEDLVVSRAREPLVEEVLEEPYSMSGKLLGASARPQPFCMVGDHEVGRGVESRPDDLEISPNPSPSHGLHNFHVRKRPDEQRSLHDLPAKLHVQSLHHVDPLPKFQRSVASPLVYRQVLLPFKLVVGAMEQSGAEVHRDHGAVCCAHDMRHAHCQQHELPCAPRRRTHSPRAATRPQARR